MADCNNVKRTIFLPRRRSLPSLMYPHQSVSEILLMLHDLDGNGEDCDQLRQELLMFADELEEFVDFRKDVRNGTILEVNLDGLPLGFRKEMEERPTLRQLLKHAWDVIANCTTEFEWMRSWYATHLLVLPWLAASGEDKILLKCVRAP